MGAVASRCNEAVFRLIELAYQVDDDTGSLANVDGSTGVFERFPVPWGRSYQRWGLVRTEQAVLALHVKRLHESPTVAPLWTYDELGRRWGVNLFDYTAYNQAIAYWKRASLTAKDYQMIAQTVRNERAK